MKQKDQELYNKILETIEKDKQIVTIKQLANTIQIPKSTLRDMLKRINKLDEIKLLLKANKSISSSSKKIDVTETVRNDKKEQKLKFELELYKKKYQELLKHSVPVDNLIEKIKKDIKQFNSLDEEYIEYNIDDFDLIHSDEELILLLSDTHLGEVVDLSNIVLSDMDKSLNQYNIDIFKQRMQTLYDSIKKFKLRLENDTFKYRKFNIFMLGDMVSGMIHEELLRGSALTISDQVVMGAEIIADFIYKLAHLFPEIDVVCVVGNHGRYEKKVSFKNKWNSFDYLLYKFIEIKLENIKNVEFYIPKSPIIVVNKFNKWNFLLRHGDGKSQSFAGIPVYGIMRTSAKATQMLSGLENIYIHYEVMGHYHSPMSLPKPAGRIIINGTLKGTDEFSMNSFLTSDVSQKLLILNEKHGIYANIDIYCN